MRSTFPSILLILCALLCRGGCTLNYDDLQAMGVSCPGRDNCEGYMNDRSYKERSCECDRDCTAYGDCCVDATARRRNSARARNNLKCLNFGPDPHTGVYAISTCSSNWNGLREVRQKCLGAVDMRDPLSAAPVTSVSQFPGQSKTYRNLFCAECNNANMTSLKTFQIGMACNGLEHLPQEQILGDLTYNEELGSWGVYRFNGTRNIFVGCAIIFEVPSYLNTSVRFCRSNVVSTCAANWTRQVVRRECDEYMAVVYGEWEAYRNPHCAICNHKTVAQISCMQGVHMRKRPMSFALLLDVNMSDGDQVGMRRVATPECPSDHKYDPFFKKCRRLVCALPGHVVVDGRCVRG